MSKRLFKNEREEPEQQLYMATARDSQQVASLSAVPNLFGKGREAGWPPIMKTR